MREMNLLPEEYLHEQEEKKKKRKFILLTSIFVTILIVIYLIVLSINFVLERRLFNLDSDIVNLENIEESGLRISAYENFIITRKDLLDRLDSENVDQFTFLNALEKTLPIEITLDMLSYSGENSFHLEGITIQEEKISEFMVNLSKIKGVENVMLYKVNYPVEENRSPYFSIDFTYLLEESNRHDIN